jgi:hypothetical protein
MELYQLEDEARKIRQKIQAIKSTIDEALDPDHLKLKDRKYYE